MMMLNMNPSNASRRDFLKASMLAGLGASLANMARSPPAHPNVCRRHEFRPFKL